MSAITKALLRDTDFQNLINAMDAGKCPALVSGLSVVNRAYTAACLREVTGRPLVFVVAEEGDADRAAADLAAFTGEEVAGAAARDFVFYNVESVSREREQKRLRLMRELMCGRAPVTVVTADGLMQRTLPPKQLEAACLSLKVGECYELEEVCARLVRAGYKRTEQVEGSGQFALRGGILDFFSPSMERPVRCEFFGDEIDSMGEFDVESQRRRANLFSAEILPASESSAQLCEGFREKLEALGKRVSRRKSAHAALAGNIYADMERWDTSCTLAASDRYIDIIFDELCCLADYIPADALVVIDDPQRVTERIKNYVWQLDEDAKALIENGSLEGSQAKLYVPEEQLFAKLSEYAAVMLDNFTRSRYPMKLRTLINMSAKQLSGFGASIETAVSDIRHYMNTGYSTVVLCADATRAKNLAEMLNEAGVEIRLDTDLMSLPKPGEAVVGAGVVSGGMEYPMAKFALVTEGLGAAAQPKKRAVKRGKSNREKLSGYADLSPGDLVVHEIHGIGRFVGIFPMQMDGVTKDYVKIAYQGTDSLYVPATQLDYVSKYIGAGGEDKPVKLSKLGGTDWSRAKSRAKGAAKEMARELIALYAQRQRLQGHAFAPDSVWQTEFEEAFGYRETDDQLRCIAEIKQDMERPVPMDRLLCGDVGYGKTEVALRAAMKCILDGKQAAILVPTTVLAQQHSITAERRFSKYPVRIEVLSRFRTPAQIKQTIQDIKTGAVDLVIGTHRLIQKDIQFKNLGLLIVDEEQRFGVAHKERLKEMSRQVDVLTLSATPIPRTLNMAMSGIRDMSVIEEPPEDRQPVQTYVLEHNWSILGDAMRRELARGGQVYYLHNRIDSIGRTAARIAELVPDAVVAVAHGKMHEEELGDIMERMSAGEIQVLVCTTIIETGIDIPNVNTLIIEDADRLGLAQLHQIRGRVGRSARHAFAYMTFRQGKALTDDASKRLAAIREFAEFNSGFRIAMRDLEIRGAGNLLGAEQSGHMISVGYDMYLKLLEEAVLEEQGKKPELRTECAADLAVSANIPERYIPSAEQRMDMYRRIAAIRTEEDADDVTDELIDRYGDPPAGVNTLIHVALLRGMASRAGISEISQKSGWVVFKFPELDPELLVRLVAQPELKDRVRIEMATVLTVRMRIKSPRRVIDEAVDFVERLAALAAQTDE